MTTDVVAIFNADFRQILKTAQPARANVMEQATLPQHPLETGAMVSDHKYVLPVEIELTFFLRPGEYRNTYQEIRQLFASNQLVTVQTRTGSYNNMTIAQMPHDETADMLDAALMPVKFREVQQSTAQFGPLPPSSVRRIEQSSTVDRGEQMPGATSDATSAQGSTLYGIFNE